MIQVLTAKGEIKLSTVKARIDEDEYNNLIEGIKAFEEMEETEWQYSCYYLKKVDGEETEVFENTLAELTKPQPVSSRVINLWD